MSAFLVRPLAEVGSADAVLAGGKAAGLGELIRAGFPVPPGFVVLTSAFPSGLAGSLSAVPAAVARERVAAAPVPASLAASVTAAYESLGADRPAVAVRSSAPFEDSSAASFAGMQDTYLGVRGADAVLDAVRRCWASLHNDESVAYQRARGLPPDGLAMAVVVQLMVRPRAAGVMFTRSPVTGDRSVVAIEGTWGLGSALVGGEVTPDHLTVSKVTGEITGRQVGSKLRLHSFEPNGPGFSASAMPLALRGRSCLSDDEARALAAFGRRVEEHYGVPQDIEWALLGELPGSGSVELPGDAAALLPGDAAERIRLLQSRPETVWAAREQAPVATPKPRASDHVLAWLEKPM